MAWYLVQYIPRRIRCVMCLEDRVSIFGDCAINPNPNAEQLAEIAISSAKTAKDSVDMRIGKSKLPDSEVYC